MVKNHNDQLLIGPLWDPTMNWLRDVTTIEQTSIVIMIFHYVFSFRFRVKASLDYNSFLLNLFLMKIVILGGIL